MGVIPTFAFCMVLYSVVLRLLTVAGKLDEAGSHAAYHKVMDAVACFEKGNEMLAEVLKEQE